jgi:hypothetical protein
MLCRTGGEELLMQVNLENLMQTLYHFNLILPDTVTEESDKIFIGSMKISKK